MATPAPPLEDALRPAGPAWASWLGVAAILLGVFLTAVHGNELMKQAVIAGAMPASGAMPAPDCPPEELEEEGLSLAECEFMVANVRGVALSAPDWFPRYQMLVSGLGAGIAFLSIIIGAALVNFRVWAPLAAVLAFGALAAVDVAGFIGVVNTGPLLRQAYLADILLWFVIHFILTVGAVAGLHSRRSD